MTLWHNDDSTCLWQEDDSCSTGRDETRERLEGAWKRLFGVKYPGRDDALDTHDEGDCMMYLHGNGVVVNIDYTGESIHQLAEVPSAKDVFRATYHASFKSGAGLPEDEDDFEHLPELPAQDSGEIQWSPDQLEAVETIIHALKSDERVMLLKGQAGTGKTTVAQEIAKRAAGLGWHVKYLAPTGKAAKVISNIVGQPARTIHSALFKRVTIGNSGQPIFHDPKQLAIGKVLFICDEASMVGKRLHQQIVKNLGPRAALLYLGDDGQLGPVADTWGPDFSNPTAELTTVHRQGKGDPILDVATEVRAGNPLPKQDIIGIEGKSYTRRGGNLAQVSQWLIEHLNVDNDAVVLCFTNKTRKKINTLARFQLGYRDKGPVVVNEQMIVLKNNNRLGWMNGETFVVKGIRPLDIPNAKKDHGIVILDTSEGELITQLELIGQDPMLTEQASRKYASVIDPFLWVPIDYAYGLTVHKCVHPDTLVETPDGIYPIRSIPSEGKILTPRGFRPYLNKVVNPSRRALEIETENGYRVTVTPEHGIDVFDDTKGFLRQEARSLATGDWLRLKLGAYTERSNAQVVLHRVKTVDSREVALPRQPDLLNEEVAELLGLMVGDGTVFRRGIRLVKRHQEVTERFAFLIRSVFGVEPDKIQIHGTSGFEVCSKHIRRWFAAVGGCSPWSKEVPRCILEGSLVVQAAFLRGIFEDGSVHVKNGKLDHIEIRQDSHELIDSLRYLLLRQGIISSIIRGKLQMPNIAIYGVHAKVFGEKVGFISKLKSDRVQEPSGKDTRNRVPMTKKELQLVRLDAKTEGSQISIYDAKNAKVNGYMSRDKALKLRNQDHAHIHYDRIAKISIVECPSVCVEVPDGHQFLQNGFFGWNSQGSQYDHVCFVIEHTFRWMIQTKRMSYDDACRLCYTAATRGKKTLMVFDARR